MKIGHIRQSRSWILFSTGMMLLVCTVAACTDAEPRVLTARNGTQVFVGAEAGSGAEASLSGTIVAVAGQCLGIRSEGQLRERTVVWPKGTRISGEDPLTLRIAGKRVQIGDRVALTGGESRDTGIGLPSVCDTLPPWVASEVGR